NSGGDSQIYFADIQLQFNHRLITLDRRFIENNDVDSGKKSNGSSQTPIGQCEFLDFLRLPQCSVPARHLLFYAQNGDGKLISWMLLCTSAHQRVTVLKQCQYIRVENVQAHRYSGSSSTCLRYSSIAFFHSSIIGSPLNMPANSIHGLLFGSISSPTTSARL